MMRSRELAELLLRKAAQDEFTLKKLSPDPASPDEVLGFHAQQAIEKMLKYGRWSACGKRERGPNPCCAESPTRRNGDSYVWRLDCLRLILSC